MDIIKKIWPTPFKVEEKNAEQMVVQLIVFVAAFLVASILIWILHFIPIVNILCGILGTLVDVYCLVGIALVLLRFFGVLKN